MNNAIVGSARKVYFDSNAIIYFLEDEGPLQAKVAAIFYDLIEKRIPLATSELAIVECLFGAYKRRNSALKAAYHRLFFQDKAFELVTLDFDILSAAAHLGAENGLKLMDAAHFSSAIASRCDAFLTNDARIRPSHGVDVVRLRNV